MRVYINATSTPHQKNRIRPQSRALIRAARDLKLKESSFAMQVAFQAIRHLVEGRGYEPSPLDIDEAVEHLMVAAARLVEVNQARQALQRIAGSALSAGLMAESLARNIAALEFACRDGLNP